MTLFNLGKKKEEKKTSTCCGGDTELETGEATSCCCSSSPKVEEISSCCGKSIEGVCCIKVLGSGCKNCHSLLEATKEATHKIGLNIEVEYITDMEKIMEYGVMSMPALVVNEQIASMGKVLKASDVEKLLRQYEE